MKRKVVRSSTVSTVSADFGFESQGAPDAGPTATDGVVPTDSVVGLALLVALYCDPVLVAGGVLILGSAATAAVAPHTQHQEHHHRHTHTPAHGNRENGCPGEGRGVIRIVSW